MNKDTISHISDSVNLPPPPQEKHIFKKAAHLIGKNYKVFPAFICNPSTWRKLTPHTRIVLLSISLLTLDHKKLFITYNLSALASFCCLPRTTTWKAITCLLKLSYVEIKNYKGRKVIMLNMALLFNCLSAYGFEAIKEVSFDKASVPLGNRFVPQRNNRIPVGNDLNKKQE